MTARKAPPAAVRKAARDRAVRSVTARPVAKVRGEVSAVRKQERAATFAPPASPVKDALLVMAMDRKAPVVRVHRAPKVQVVRAVASRLAAVAAAVRMVKVGR